MMSDAIYDQRRGRLQTYFNATAMDAWAQLTSDAPVSRIRQTVRAGRDRMRDTLLSWLPQDLSGARLLDAGCGTGALSVVAAQRGCAVTAVDIAANLVEIARDRAPANLAPGSISFQVGDMLDPAFGRFDHVVAMDSLIHYPTRQIVNVIEGVADRTDRSILLTFAPQTPALTVMHAMGRLFPRSNRAPEIIPVRPSALVYAIEQTRSLRGWRVARTERVSGGFYTSQALELVRR
jgi:magnesium-protoporphyrin O-methyltransferase